MFPLLSFLTYVYPCSRAGCRETIIPNAHGIEEPFEEDSTPSSSLLSSHHLDGFLLYGQPQTTMFNGAKLQWYSSTKAS